MNATRKLAVAGVGILGLAGAGAGTALAQANQTAVKPQVPVTTAATTPAAGTPAAGDTDNLQQGSQTAPDQAGTSEADKAGAEVEKSSAEEPGDANLPGGGHADPPGQNVDHQFQGVE